MYIVRLLNGTFSIPYNDPVNAQELVNEYGGEVYKLTEVEQTTRMQSSKDQLYRIIYDHQWIGDYSSNLNPSDILALKMQEYPNASLLTVEWKTSEGDFTLTWSSNDN